MDPNPGYEHFLKVNQFFLTKQDVKLFFFFFSLIFNLKLRRLGNFYILTIFNSSDFGIKFFYLRIKLLGEK